jgi:hypothetical protein
VKECESILKNLKVTKRTAECVLQCAEIYQGFVKQVLVEQFSRKELYPETIQVFEAWVCHDSNQKYKKWWKNYCQWVQTKPLLRGGDLKKMGYIPGPQFKQILEQLTLERFKGRLHTKTDEIHFVTKHFPYSAGDKW